MSSLSGDPSSSSLKSVAAAVAGSWTGWPVNVDLVVRRVCRTLHGMLRARGCEHVDGATCCEEAEAALARGVPAIVGGPSPRVVVYLTADERTPVKVMRGLMEANADAGCLLIVSVGGLTPFAKKELAASARSASTLVQDARYRDHVWPVVEHASVPRHVLASVQDLEGEDTDRYPKILASEPVCQYYGFRAGDVVETVRVTGSTDPKVFRRKVVAP